MKRNSYGRWAKATTLFVAFGLGASTLWAQSLDIETQLKQDAAKNKSGKVEKIQVTGSHIKRTDVEGPSPILTLDKEYIQQTGYNNMADVLRDLPVASFGGNRENALNGQANTGAGGTSLRGFSSDRVLVLLNGRRLPTIGGGSQVDLNLIPVSAIERIEILKDGASALYGSDALGGVMNFITKKNFDGAMVEISYTQPELVGGAQTDIRATYGKQWSNASLLGVVQYKNSQPTWSRDRDFTRVDGDLNALSNTGSPGSWRNVNNVNGKVTNGPWKTSGGSVSCPTNQIKKVNNKAGESVPDRCGFDYSQYSQITPQSDQFSALLNADYEFNESVKTYFQGLYVRREVAGELAPSPDNFKDDTGFGGRNYLVPVETAKAWGLQGVTDPVDLRYRLVEEAGPRRSQVNTDTYGLQQGFSGYMGDTWEWEASVNYGSSRTSNRGVNGYANKNILYSMIQNDPSSFNPFAASGQKSDISAAIYVPEEIIESSVATLQLQTAGELGQIGNAPVGLAIGVATNWQTFDQSADQVTRSRAQWGGGTSATGNGRRDFQSAYTELSISPWERLELQAAGRFDQFSDFGSTINPKLAFRLKATDQLMFRGSWGTGFKAPTLEELYQADNVIFPFGYDPQTDFVGQFQTIGSGNRNLSEENSESINFGLVVEPAKRISFTMDYWRTSMDSVVTQLDLRDVFLAEANPNIGPAGLKAKGIEVVRPDGDQIDRIVLPFVNLAERNVEGMDFGFNAMARAFGSWNFRFNMQHALILKLIEEPFPGLGRENRVGFAGNPHWRNTASLSLSNPTYSTILTARTTGKTDADFNTPGTGKTRDHTELDLRLGYNTSWKGQFVLGVRNLFNTDRPWQNNYRSAGFINDEIYDPFGRSVYLQYRQSF